MLPYGLPRIPDAWSGDSAELGAYARATRFGKWSKTSAGKRNTRRIWKKRERLASRLSLAGSA